MKKNILAPLATLLVFGCTLVACGGTPAKAKLNDSYILGELGEGTAAPGSKTFETYQVNFYEGNVYECISTEITYGYSMLLGTTTNITYGTYVQGESEDGVTAYTLNKASEVIFNSYSKMGGYNISINTADANQTYPTEILAQTQGEKSYANNKEEVIAEYGLGTVIYCDDKNTFTFINPNDETDEKDVIETASGSVARVLDKKITNVQVASEIATAANGEEYRVYQVMVFEDLTYQYISTTITYGYSMLLGTTTINSFGTCEYGESEDGYTPLTLKRANDVIFNSYSKMGGYNISINTMDANQTYPVEILAQTQGEKSYANSKEEVIDNYGTEKTFYSNNEKNDMSLVNPNA